MSEGQLDFRNVPCWHPTLCDEGLPPDIVIEEIEGFKDELLFPSHILPATKAFSNLHQFPSPCKTRVVQHRLQVFNTGSNLTEGVRTPVCIGVNWI